MTLYHTALKKGSLTYLDVPETNYVEHPLGLMIKSDIINEGLPQQMLDCDVIYAEPPWPHGFKIFNERAGIKHNDYNDLSDAIKEAIVFCSSKEASTPFYLLLGKTMLSKLPDPNELHETILNGNDAFMAVWNDSYEGNLSSTYEICHTLGGRYKKFGDFTCGYGACVKAFLEGGGESFIASDYDGKCITVMSANLKKLKAKSQKFKS